MLCFWYTICRRKHIRTAHSVKMKDASDKFSRNLKYGELRKVQVI